MYRSRVLYSASSTVSVTVHSYVLRTTDFVVNVHTYLTNIQVCVSLIFLPPQQREENASNTVTYQICCVCFIQFSPSTSGGRKIDWYSLDCCMGRVPVLQCYSTTTYGSVGNSSDLCATAHFCAVWYYTYVRTYLLPAIVKKLEGMVADGSS